MSLPVRGAWIEIFVFCKINVDNRSLPVRGAWIEIGYDPGSRKKVRVAPRKGSVD